MRGVVQLFLQRFFGIQKLQKHHVAGNAAASKILRQEHALQEDPKITPAIWQKLLQSSTSLLQLLMQGLLHSPNL